MYTAGYDLKRHNIVFWPVLRFLVQHVFCGSIVYILFGFWFYDKLT